MGTDLGATEKFAYGPILPITSSTATFRRYRALQAGMLCVNCNCSTYPGPLHQFAIFSTTAQRISKISVSMKSSVHVLSKYEGITMFEFLKFDTWANNRHIGCTFVVQRWVHRDPYVADLDSWRWTILGCQRSWKYENMKKPWEIVRRSLVVAL